MSSLPANLGIADWDGSQNAPQIPVNEGIALGVTLALAAVAKGTETPPGSPAEGDMHIVGATPTGAWSAFTTDNIARYHNGAWQEIKPATATTVDRLMLWVDNSGDAVLWMYDAGAATWKRAGVAELVFDAGTKTTGTYTPASADGGIQKAVNGGAHTLAPPAEDCRLVIQYTNNASAGALTTSGFDKVTGDTITTTDGHDFFFELVKVGTFSHLHVKALQ